MIARIRTLVIDKTGTLTDGRARIVRIDAAPGQSPEEVLQAAASLDQASKHVIAQTIVFEAHDRRLRLAVPTNVIETAGEGIEGRVEGRNVVLGGVRFVTSKPLRAEGRSIRRPTQPGAAIVAVAIDGKLAAHSVLADELRPGVIDILRSLRRLRVERTVLATSAPIWAWSQAVSVRGGRLRRQHQKFGSFDRLPWLAHYQIAIPATAHKRTTASGGVR